MESLLLFLFIAVCFTLMIVILLQSSKGGGLAGAFGGGGGMGAVFGGRGAASFLGKVTTYLVVAYMVIALLLSFANRGRTSGQSLVQQEQEKRGSVPAAALPLIPTGDAQATFPTEAVPVPDSRQQ